MADDFFGEDVGDPFDSIVRQFFGSNGRGRLRRRTDIDSDERESEIGFVEGNGKVFLIIEMPGFDENDITIDVDERNLEIRAKKRKIEGVKEYLTNRLKEGMIIRKSLPSNASAKKFLHTFRNGILEVALDKK